MRLFFLVAVLAGLLVTSCALTPDRDFRDAALVTVQVMRHDGAGGTGVPVQCDRLDDGRWTIVILTARHVVEGQDLSTWSVNIGLHRWVGTPTLIAKHPTTDAALLRVESDRPIECVPIRWEHPNVGERVWVIGYPAMTPHRVITDGWVGDVGHASAEVFPGNSGGPVIDSEGRLVGIVLTVGVHVQTDDPHYIHHDMGFLPMERLRGWLDNTL